MVVRKGSQSNESGGGRRKRKQQKAIEVEVQKGSQSAAYTRVTLKKKRTGNITGGAAEGNKEKL